MKEGKYAKTLAKFLVTTIFLMQDMRRNFLPKIRDLYGDAMLLPIRMGTNMAAGNRNICHWVLLQKREFIPRGTLEH